LKDDRLGSFIQTSALQQQSAIQVNQSKSKYPILQPIIDLLQYQVFLDRIRNEVTQVVYALQIAGIPTSLIMNIVGETGKELIKLLDTKSNLKIGGEIVLRIFSRYVW